MDILNILQSVGVIFTQEQKHTFKKEFHKYYKNTQELRKMKTKLEMYQRQFEMYEEELEAFKKSSNTYQQRYEDTYKNLIYLQNSNKIREFGINEQYVSFVQMEILQYVREDTDFNSALKKYIKEHPQYTVSKK